MFFQNTITLPITRMRALIFLIETIQVQAKEKGISGKRATPFLLGNIVKRSEGKSLAANIQLVYNNAKVGAQIAVELSKL